MEKAIKWVKYENLVNKDLNISKLLMTGKFIKSRQEDEEEPENEYEYSDDEDDEDGHMIMQFPITHQVLTDIKLCSDYECWVGHTNFDITTEMKNILNKIEGVEYLDIISRYRFIIGLGEFFSLTKVRLDIEKKLGVKDENK